MKRAFFDPATPKTLLRWEDARIITWDESQAYRLKGAKWMILAFGPYDKTERGAKHVEVRDTKPWLDRFQVGDLVILGRGRTGQRLLVRLAERREYPNLAAVPDDWIRGADLGPEVGA